MGYFSASIQACVLTLAMWMSFFPAGQQFSQVLQWSALLNFSTVRLTRSPQYWLTKLRHGSTANTAPNAMLAQMTPITRISLSTLRRVLLVVYRNKLKVPMSTAVKSNKSIKMALMRGPMQMGMEYLLLNRDFQYRQKTSMPAVAMRAQIGDTTEQMKPNQTSQMQCEQAQVKGTSVPLKVSQASVCVLTISLNLMSILSTDCAIQQYSSTKWILTPRKDITIMLVNMTRGNVAESDVSTCMNEGSLLMMGAKMEMKPMLMLLLKVMIVSISHSSSVRVSSLICLMHNLRISSIKKLNTALNSTRIIVRRMGETPVPLRLLSIQREIATEIPALTSSSRIDTTFTMSFLRALMLYVKPMFSQIMSVGAGAASRDTLCSFTMYWVLALQKGKKQLMVLPWQKRRRVLVSRSFPRVSSNLTMAA